MRIPLVQFDIFEEGQPSPPVREHNDWQAGELVEMRRAQSDWAARPIGQRLAVIRGVRHGIARRSASLAAVAGRGTCYRPPAETLSSQVLPLADACRFLEQEARGILAPRFLGTRGRPAWLSGVSSEVRREAYGVVLIIAPANYPLFIPGVTALQALAAGNAVLIKPGEQGTDAALALAGLLRNAGLPNHLLRVLPESPDAARQMITAGVDKVVFTGSADTAEDLLHQLAPELTPATMELSGCDAVVVRADADLDLAVNALRFGLRLNRGATCIAPRRVFVHRAVAAALEKRLVAELRKDVPFRIGSRNSQKTFLLLSETLRDGGRMLTGRILPGGGVVGPVVVSDVTLTMRLLREELFAPVLALVPVAGDEEALQNSRQCPYALGANIFSSDERAARALAARMDAGVVLINDLIVPTADPRIPFGGRRRSGFGVTRGAEGLLEMTVPKVIALRRGRWRPHVEPAEPGDAALFQAYIQLAHGQGWAERVRALVKLVKCLRHRNKTQREIRNLTRSVEIL